MSKPKRKDVASKRPPAPVEEARDPRLLKPYAQNARRHPPEQIEALAESYRLFGFVGRIVIDDRDEIVAGHGRQEAALLAKLAEVPVLVLRGWTEAQKKAFRVVDNKLAEASEWDPELLAIEVRGLDEDEGFDLGPFFGADELEKLLAEPAPPPPEKPPAAPPTEFQAFGESIPTDFCCPKCSYRWSGKANAGAATDATL